MAGKIPNRKYEQMTAPFRVVERSPGRLAKAFAKSTGRPLEECIQAVKDGKRRCRSRLGRHWALKTDFKYVNQSVCNPCKEQYKANAKAKKLQKDRQKATPGPAVYKPAPSAGLTGKRARERARATEVPQVEIRPSVEGPVGGPGRPVPGYSSAPTPTTTQLGRQRAIVFTHPLQPEQSGTIERDPYARNPTPHTISSNHTIWYDRSTSPNPQRVYPSQAIESLEQRVDQLLQYDAPANPVYIISDTVSVLDTDPSPTE